MVEYLQNKYSLMDVMFSNLEFYCEQIRTIASDPEKLAKEHEISVNDLHTLGLFDDFAHQDQIKERLDFIRFLATSSVKISLKDKHI